METLTKKYQLKNVGEVHQIKESLGGYTATVIDGGSKRHYCTIQIEDWISEVAYNNLKNGVIKYPYHKTVFNIGYRGEGNAIIKSKGRHSIEYRLWKDMMERCYSEKSFIENPTYIDVTVCAEWHNFNTFAKWFDEKASCYKEGYHLDKDLLSENTKVYSPSTCIFIPQALNNFLTNTKVTNTSGYIGVSWHKRRNKWHSEISHPKTGKRTSLGYFMDIKEASKAYQKKRAVYARWWRYVAKKMYNLPENVIKNIK